MSVFVKKFLFAVEVVLILLIGIAIGKGLKSNNTASVVDNATPITTESIAENINDNSNIASGASENAAINGNKVGSNLAKVIRVIDGDTIQIGGGEQVRYIGIDTSETVDPRKPVQCFGVEATNKNKQLVDGKIVRLEKDITDKDNYNRLLRYVFVGDIFVNLELVKQGFAYSYSYPPDIKYQEQFLKAQQEARDDKRGLWNSCPASAGSAGSQITENSFLMDNNQSADPSLCLIKGNISSSGEKIYHLPGCGSYSKTSISEARGEKWFCVEAEAQAAGWRKAQNCP